jgi:uncharacterized RDD family membrane protein YckC
MAKLIVNPTSSSRREIALPRSLLSIGRDPSNDLVLPDAMVSRRHAVIEFRSSQYFLRDCNSSNGSLVNGDRVSERSLRDGDLMAIGTARLLFREEAEALDSEAKVVQHPSAPRLECPSCQSDYRKGDLFCRNCGRTLADVGPPKSVCASCGTVVPLPANFCNACGTELPGKPEKPPSIPTKPQPIPEDLRAPAAGTPVAVSQSDGDPAPRAEPEGEPPASSELAITPPSVHAVPRTPSSQGAAAPALIAPLPRPISHPFVPRPERVSESDRKPVPRVTATPAGLWPRLAAGLLDGFVGLLLEALVLAPGYLYWATRPQVQAPSEVSFMPIAVSLLLVPLALILGGGYFVYCWGVRGATPGKALFGLAVEAEDGSYPVGMGRAAARALGYLLSGRGLHDHIAGTRVVRRERI